MTRGSPIAPLPDDQIRVGTYTIQNQPLTGAQQNDRHTPPPKNGGAHGSPLPKQAGKYQQHHSSDALESGRRNSAPMRWRATESTLLRRARERQNRLCTHALKSDRTLPRRAEKRHRSLFPDAPESESAALPRHARDDTPNSPPRCDDEPQPFSSLSTGESPIPPRCTGQSPTP